MKQEGQTPSPAGGGVVVKREPAKSKYFDKPVPKPKLTLIGHGGCGANTVRDLMHVLDPGSYESCDFLVFESNGSVLDTHFSERAVRASNNQNFHNWFESRRINIEMLGDGIGAGGDPEKGKDLLSKILDALQPQFTPWHNVINVGGGGGGTASGTMPSMAKFLDGLKIPTYNIITMPRVNELSLKNARARRALGELLAISPTQVIYNENNPDKSLSIEKIHSTINQQCLYPSIYLLRALIQEVGNVCDHDIADWRSDVKKGNHGLSGLYNKVADDFDGIESGLLQNPYLNNRLIETAEALEVWLDASPANGWTEAEIGTVLNIFQSKFKNKSPDAPVEVKVGIRENSACFKKTVGFVSFSPVVAREQKEDAKVQVAVAGLPALASSEAPTSSESSNGSPTNGHQKMVRIFAYLEGTETQVPVDLPEDLANDYNSLSKGNMTKDRNMFAIQTQAKIEKFTGRVLHVPLAGGGSSASA